MEHPGGGSGGGRLPDRGQELGSRLQGLPRRRRRQGRAGPGPARGAGGQHPVPLPGGADRDRRPAPRRAEHPRGRPPAGSRPLDGLPRAAPQRPRPRALPAVRGASRGHHSSDAASPAPAGGQRRAARARGRAPRATVEPAAGQPPSGRTVPPRAVDAAVPREHLPGRLPAGLGSAAPVTVGAAPPVPAAHRPGPPAGAPTTRATPAEVRAADADDPPAPVPAPGPQRARAASVLRKET